MINCSLLPTRVLIIPAPAASSKYRRTDVFWQVDDPMTVLTGTNGGYFTTSTIFKYDEALLISAYGIPEGARILCELLTLTPTTAGINFCGKYAYDLIEGSVISEGFVQSPGRKVDTNGDLLTTIWNMSSEDPIALLTGLQKGQYYQLVYDFGANPPNPMPTRFPLTVQYSEADEKDFAVFDYGSQNVSYTDRPDLWVPTGITRCLLPDDAQTAVDIGNGTAPREERLLVGPNGQTHWELIRLLHWEDTGRTRVLPDGSVVEKEQTTYCGQTKWIDADIKVAAIPLTPVKEDAVTVGSWNWSSTGSSSGNLTAQIVVLEDRPWIVDITGYAFTADQAPSNATVSIAMPHGTGTCFIYPVPQIDATVPVWSKTNVLLGYARQDSLGWSVFSTNGASASN